MRILLSRSLHKKTLQALHSSLSRRTMSATAEKSWREFEVPVPWGKLAGKDWGGGESGGQPPRRTWIALHGWQDNCGTFDTLAPLFPSGHRILALDIPGHGFSSHNPAGFPYHFADGLTMVRRVAAHFGLSRFSLMGHSMGGGMSTIFAATHPEMVEKLVVFDMAAPAPRDVDALIKRTRSHVDTLLNVERKMREDKQPSYTYEEAKERLKIASAKLHGTDVLTEESVEVLLRRGVVPAPDDPNRVVYSRDLKHIIPGLYGYPVDFIVEFAKAIKCPHLCVLAKCDSYPDMRKRRDAIVAMYKSCNKDFVVADVEGTHHVHLNNPDRVYEHIEAFLERKKQEEEREQPAATVEKDSNL